MDPVAQPVQPIGIEQNRPQAEFLRALLRNLQAFWSKELHRLNRVLPKDGTEAMTGPLELKTYTVATLPTASDFGGSVIYVSDGGPAWSRALVGKQFVQAILNNTSTDMILQIVDYDDGGWFGTTGDTFLTVPTGVTRVRMHSNVNWDAEAGTIRVMSFTQEGSGFLGSSSDLSPPTVVTTQDIKGISSPTVDCTAGDKFRVNVLQTSGSTVNILVGNNTYFGIEAVEFAEGYGGTFQGSNGSRWVPLG